MPKLSTFDFVFVVLVYRNTSDLLEFFDSLNVPNSKVIVVNSFYDNESESKFREIAKINNADFLSVPNKGYGYGNNRGCEYVLNHYNFKYLVISNADIQIERLCLGDLAKCGRAVVAPDIINLSGKRQNPSSPFVPSRILEYLKYFLYKHNHRHIIWILYAYSRLTKIFYYGISRIRRTIFSAHGAFVIIPFGILEELYPIYNEEMFLFNEEEHFGRLAQQKGIRTIYVPEIVVRHKEDGSMKVASIDDFQMSRQSFLAYFNFWKDSL